MYKKTRKEIREYLKQLKRELIVNNEIYFRFVIKGKFTINIINFFIDESFYSNKNYDNRIKNFALNKYVQVRGDIHSNKNNKITNTQIIFEKSDKNGNTSFSNIIENINCEIFEFESKNFLCHCSSNKLFYFDKD